MSVNCLAFFSDLGCKSNSTIMNMKIMHMISKHGLDFWPCKGEVHKGLDFQE